jgi:hypothetical protein
MLISDTNWYVNDDSVIVFKHVYLFTVSNGNLQPDFCMNAAFGDTYLVVSYQHITYHKL